MLLRDGKADYVWTQAHDGATIVHLNNCPNKPTWLPGQVVAGGVGTSGANVRFAGLQNTGRASYLAIDPSYGSLSAWHNGCTEIIPSKQNNTRQLSTAPTPPMIKVASLSDGTFLT
jgi:hypothetical protein